MIGTWYARQAREGLEVQNNIAEIKIRAERRIGELSRELPIEQGVAKKTHSPHDEENVTKTEALKNAGIAIGNANRYEAIADIPEAEFEAEIKEMGRLWKCRWVGK